MKNIKILSLILALALVICTLAGCSDGSANQDEEQEQNNENSVNGENSGGETSDTEDSTPGYVSDFNFSDGLTDEGFFEGVNASEIVELPQYKGVSMPAETLVASEEAIQAQIDAILENYVTYRQITDRAVADGDTVNIDYVGSIDGEEFAGGSTGGAGTTVTIGVTSYIDGFLDQLVGHKPGEKFDINVTFPEDYMTSPDLAGKDAVFNVTINYIQGEAIERELDSGVAEDYGFETVAEFRRSIVESIVDEQKTAFVDSIIMAGTCDQIPESVVDYISNVDLYSMSTYATYYGMTVDEFITMVYGYESREEYLEAARADIEALATNYLCVQAIAETEGLTVTTDHIAQAGYESYVEAYGEAYVKQNLLWDLVVRDFIVDNAVIVDSTDE